jgi:WD40 repeat protein
MTHQHDPDSSDRDHRLDQAIAAYLAAEDDGNPPARDEFLNGYPDIADGLLAFFREHDRFGRLAQPLHDAAAPVAATVDVQSHDAGSTAGAMDRPDDGVPAVGDRVPYFGDYQLLKVLGHGGMGVVYRARQISLNRQVALKMIAAGELASDADLRRFRNEAEAVAGLDHPHIVPIYEVGEHDGRHYFSMKLIPGGSLAQRLSEFTAEPRNAARLLATVAEAINHAHRRGILHRDLKPSNILVDEEGDPHVTDFGLAKRVEGDSELTQSGAIVGTPAYMAPEQASGRRGSVTTATDVYGLGAVLYAMLTGRPPFRGESVLEVLQQVREQGPEPPSRVNPRVPRDLETVCLKCLEKDPRRRYDSAAALAEDLGRWLRGEPIVARPVGRSERLWLWCRRNPVVASLVGAVTALLVALAVGSTIAAYQYERLARKERLTADKAVEAERAAQTKAEEARQKAEEARRNAYFADMNLAQVAWERGDLARVDDLLTPYVPRPGEADLRGWEWHYQWRLSHNALQTIQLDDDFAGVHPGGLSTFSSDGRWLAFAGDKAISVFEVDTGQCVARLSVGPYKRAATSLQALAFDAQGQTLMLVEVEEQVVVLRRWQWQTGQSLEAVRWTLPGKVGHAVIAADGRIIVDHIDEWKQQKGTADSDRKAEYLALLEPDTARFSRLLTFNDFKADPHAHRGSIILNLRLSPNGMHLACEVAFYAGREFLLVLDLDKLRRDAVSDPWSSLCYRSGKLVDFAFSPDGRWLACVEERERERVVVLVDLPTGRRIKTYRLDGSAYKYQRIWFLPPDGQSLVALGIPLSLGSHYNKPGGTGFGDSTGQLIDLDPLPAIGRSILFSWDIARGGNKPEVVIIPKNAYFAKIAPNLISPDGRRFAAWPRWPTVEINELSPFEAGGWPIVGTGDDVIELFGIHAQRWIYFRFLGGDFELSVVDTRNQRLTRYSRLPYPEEFGYNPIPIDLLVKEDGQRMLTVESIHDVKKSQGQLVSGAWDLDSGRLEHSVSFPASFDPERNVHLSSDGRFVAYWQKKVESSTGPSRLRRWDIVDGREAPTDRWAQDLDDVLAFSPDGRLVAGSLREGSEKDRVSLIVRDTASGQEVARLSKSSSAKMGHAAFSPVGHVIAMSDRSGDVSAWDFSEGRSRLFGRLPSLDADGRPDPDAFCRVDFHPDGSRLLASNLLQSKLWDIASGREIQSWSRAVDWTEPGFLADGRLILGWGRVLDPRPITDEIRDEREALALIRRLINPPRAREDVLAAIRAEQPLREPVRRRALTLASGLLDVPNELIESSQNRIEWPYTRAEDYHLVVGACEAVLRGENYGAEYYALEALQMLGTAHYRLGEFKEALAALRRFEAARHASNGIRIFDGTIAYLALTLHRLGRASEAREALQTLKLRMVNAKRFNTTVEVDADILHEAESLIGPMDASGELPADPFAP